MEVKELLNIDKETKIRKFSLLDFIDFYVENSLEIAENNLSLYDFDSELLMRISLEFDINREAINYLKNPFYWYFGSEKSPIKFVEIVDEDIACKYKIIISDKSDVSKQAYALLELNKKSTFIRFKDNYDINDINARKITGSIYNKYEKYFNSRLKNLGMNGEI